MSAVASHIHANSARPGRRCTHRRARAVLVIVALVLLGTSAVLWAGPAARSTTQGAGSAPTRPTTQGAGSAPTKPTTQGTGSAPTSRSKATAAPRSAAPGISDPQDPGPRGGPAAAGGPLPGLALEQQAFFDAGRAAFGTIHFVQGANPGLGPRYSMTACSGCHGHPDAGGSSDTLNHQVFVANFFGAANTVPSFIREDGPTLEVRFKYHADGTRDGGVRPLFTIAGRTDAPGCDLVQPDFETEAARNNLAFRIPTPVFGAGLIAAVSDAAILQNLAENTAAKRALGIGGRVNRNPNDSTIGRFGWKAQNTSLLLFAAEAYNVEQGVTNEVFPTETSQTSGCLFNPTPEDETDLAGFTPADVASNVVKSTRFMQFLAPPAPAVPTASTERGRALFTTVGCALCHTPTLTTGASTIAALANQAVPLYSDLALHRMGWRLADDIVQGGGGPDEFRTAPLWGLGQRIFFLHDGRTRDLQEAIHAHFSPVGGPVGPSRQPAKDPFGESEANNVILRYLALTPDQKQDLLNFLRSL